MTSHMVDKIARAVLYEGYLLYPYRPSAIKNQQRWNFGVLYPPAWAAQQTGSDRSYFQMECLARATEAARFDISVRFLQLAAHRSDGRTWQEGLEQRISIPALSPLRLCTEPFSEEFTFGHGEELIGAQVEVSTAQIAEGIFRISVRVRNTTACQAEARDAALLRSLASAHAVLQVYAGEFLSQIDPPDEFRVPAADCQNTGVWPVLVGDSGSRDTILGSPIILYDYPQVAPESKGDLFDATEIDEILTLRILTLTDEEKGELRNSDPRARQLLERLESTPPEHLLELHGVIRGMQQAKGDAWSAWDTVEAKPAASAVVRDVELKKGDRIRLRPRNRADILDTFLEDKTAIIEAIEQDFEGRVQFAVVLDDDPGRDLGEMRQAGHRFFFSMEEVEPLTSEGVH